MKKLFVILSVLLCNLVGCTAQKAKFESLDADSFEQAIADTSVVTLDVRTMDEYASGHITGAVNVDVLADDFLTKALALLPEGKTVAVYCRSGRRSKKAAGILAEQGYKVMELETGFMGWLRAGKETVGPGSEHK